MVKNNNLDEETRERKKKFAKQMELLMMEDDLRKLRQKIAELNDTIIRQKQEYDRIRIELTENESLLDELKQKEFELKEQVLAFKRKIYSS